MSKNRREWYDALLTMGVIFGILAVAMYIGCSQRGMNPWPISIIFAVIATLLGLAALIVREGKDILAIPQAIWMAICDLFNNNRRK